MPTRTETPSRSQSQSLPRRLARAAGALRRILSTPEATENALELLHSLEPDRGKRALARLSRTKEGRALVREKPSLLDALTDRDALARLPEGSFGRAYLAHMDRYGLDALALVKLQREVDRDWSSRCEEERWWRDRSALMHDLFHVLTGLGSDRLGEARLLPFSFAQIGGLGNLTFAFAVTLRGARIAGMPWIREQWKSFQRGRRIAWLGTLHYESLLAESLETVRERIGLSTPPAAVESVAMRIAPGAVVSAPL